MRKVESSFEKSEKFYVGRAKIANNQKTNNSVQLLIENELISYFAINKTGRIVDVNSKFASVLGYTKAELLEKELNQFLPKNVEIFSALPNSSLRDEEISIIQSFIHKNGTKIHGQLNGTLFDCFENKGICTVFVFTDITDKINFWITESSFLIEFFCRFCQKHIRTSSRLNI